MEPGRGADDKHRHPLQRRKRGSDEGSSCALAGDPCPKISKTPQPALMPEKFLKEVTQQLTSFQSCLAHLGLRRVWLMFSAKRNSRTLTTSSIWIYLVD